MIFATLCLESSIEIGEIEEPERPTVIAYL
jgi:hypothetical protein